MEGDYEFFNATPDDIYYSNEAKKKRAFFYALEQRIIDKYRLTGKIENEDIIEYINLSDTIMGHSIGAPSFNKRIEHYRNVFINNAETIHKEKERIAKSKMKKRIIERVNRMENPCFFTQTFNNDTLPEEPKKYIHYWRNIFSKLNIKNWVLCSDYGSKNGRLHFHGFLDIKKELLETFPKALFTQTHKIQSGSYNFPPLASYGFNYIVSITSKEDLNKSLNYTIKYLVKDLEEIGFKHELFASRASKGDRISQEELLEKASSLLGTPFKILDD